MPSKYQMVSAIVAKMAVLSVAILIFCIRVTLLGLINAEEKKSNFRANEDTFSWWPNLSHRVFLSVQVFMACSSPGTALNWLECVYWCWPTWSSSVELYGSVAPCWKSGSVCTWSSSLANCMCLLFTCCRGCTLSVSLPWSAPCG